MGAIPYRCAACRCNFASFRPCKERFSWRHETKPALPQPRPSPPAPASSSLPAANGSAIPTVAAVTRPEVALHRDDPEDEPLEPFL
jgi:hypothetical protein